MQQDILERVIHSSGDFALENSLYFSEDACEIGLKALESGAFVLTDTAMAASAISPMANRTLGTSVRCIFEWSANDLCQCSTKTALAMQNAWVDLTRNSKEPNVPSIILIGSFDGLHLGHRKLFERAKKLKSKSKLKIGVFTFDPIPKMFFSKGLVNYRISNLNEKIALFVETKPSAPSMKLKVFIIHIEPIIIVGNTKK